VLLRPQVPLADRDEHGDVDRGDPSAISGGHHEADDVVDHRAPGHSHPLSHNAIRIGGVRLR
jgi:hypothetical protein